MPNNQKRAATFCFALFTLAVAAASCALIFYLVCLQVGAAFSLKRIFIAAAVGLIFSGLAEFALIKSIRQKKISPAYFSKTFITALTLCAILWLMVVMPANYLMAPKSQFSVTVQRTESTETGATQITYLNSGLDYISPRLIHFDPAIPDSAKGQTTSLQFDASGKTQFSWQGRAWKSITITLHSTQAAGITIKTPKDTFQVQIAPGADQTLNLPVLSSGYYAFLQLLTGIASLIVIWLCLSLIGLIRFKKAADFADSLLPRAPNQNFLNILAGGVFAAVSLWVVSLGLQNRLYSDDYCYLNELHKMGWLNAVLEWFHLINGRFSGHVFNFLAFEFPSIEIFLGPITVLLFVGGSLFFLFQQLLHEFERSLRIKWSALCSLTLLGILFLVIPDLFESTLWNLHSILVSGGFTFLLVFGALLLKQKRAENANPWLWGIFFFLWGLIGAGFNEVIAMLNIVLIGAVAVVLMIEKRGRKSRFSFTGLLAYLLGSAIGLIVVITSAGDSSRITRLGFSAEIKALFLALLNLIQSNSADIFAKNHFLPVALVLFMLVLAFYWGKTLPGSLQWFKRPLTRFERYLLAVSPFLLFFIAFFPSGFVSGYFPERALIIPLFYSLTAAFLLAFAWGNSHCQTASGNKTFALLLPLCLIVLCFPVFKYLLSFSRQMSRYSAEWDTRSRQIEQAVAQGKKEISITPYQYSPGVDLSTESNIWLNSCENDYYGINLNVVEKQP